MLIRSCRFGGVLIRRRASWFYGPNLRETFRAALAGDDAYKVRSQVAQDILNLSTN